MHGIGTIRAMNRARALDEKVEAQKAKLASKTDAMIDKDRDGTEGVETWARDVFVAGGYVTIFGHPGSNEAALEEARAVLDRAGFSHVTLSGAVFGKKV